jgi:hypothetical protein
MQYLNEACAMIADEGVYDVIEMVLNFLSDLRLKRQTRLSKLVKVRQWHLVPMDTGIL